MVAVDIPNSSIVKSAYPVMEHFYTLQGEGAYQGHAAYFIRLAGCDVGCVWCDVKESWDASIHPSLESKTIAELASSHPGKIAVVTGGEPVMYNLTPLTVALKSNGLRRHIETSGAYPLSGEWEWVCLSPKKFKAPHQSIYAKVNELKVVIYHPSDFLWAEQHAAQVLPDCRLFLQPEWSKSAQVLPLIIEYVKANPRWQACLQVHKYMDIP